mmetsp:Transcript_46647/g.77152  ORF Transcript_46647/g.77152 Transcript_46647/m.77152 type:complete len:284 (-) Transcript_46647:548-1399(-)
MVRFQRHNATMPGVTVHTDGRVAPPSRKHAIRHLVTRVQRHTNRHVQGIGPLVLVDTTKPPVAEPCVWSPYEQEGGNVLCGRRKRELAAIVVACEREQQRHPGQHAAFLAGDAQPRRAVLFCLCESLRLGRRAHVGVCMRVPLRFGQSARRAIHGRPAVPGVGVQLAVDVIPCESADSDDTLLRLPDRLLPCHIQVAHLLSAVSEARALKEAVDFGGTVGGVPVVQVEAGDGGVAQAVPAAEHQLFDQPSSQGGAVSVVEDVPAARNLAAITSRTLAGRMEPV